jgi:VanZ family protein
LTRIPYGDKAGHFILYGILTLLIDLALFQSLPNLNRNRIVFRVALVLAVLIGLEEVSQLYFPTRSFDLVDLAFSYLGVIFFSWVAVIRGRS